MSSLKNLVMMNGQLQFEYRPRANMLKTNFSSTADFLQNLEHYNVQVVEPKSDTQISTTTSWIMGTPTNSEISSITDISESSTSIDRFLHTLKTQHHQTIIACILLVIFFAIILSYFYRSLVHKKTRRNLTLDTEYSGTVNTRKKCNRSHIDSINVRIDKITQDLTNKQHSMDDSKHLQSTYGVNNVDQTDKKPNCQSWYSKYADLDRPTIANLCQFNLQEPPPSSLREPIQHNSESSAIISWTTTSKHTIMNYIRQELYDEEIQYLCVGQEINPLYPLKELYIQIIFKNKINKRTRFLDTITGTCCNYKVTQNILPWNDYIRGDFNCLEFGRFLSKLHGYKQYPSKKATEKPKHLILPFQTIQQILFYYGYHNSIP
ncbi:hypothetical protein I4U23_011286 [Adineta vaga]|nr:hypothetical protein I4U23_011286 [Adineta vaga]